MEKYALLISVISVIISLVIFFMTFFRGRVNSFNGHIAEIKKITIEYPELLYIYDKKKLDKIFDKEDEIFRNRMWAYIDLHFNIFENTYLHSLSLKLPFIGDGEIWNNFILLLFKSDTVQKRWETRKTEKVYNRKFITYIDNLLSKNEKQKHQSRLLKRGGA